LGEGKGVFYLLLFFFFFLFPLSLPISGCSPAVSLSEACSFSFFFPPPLEGWGRFHKNQRAKSVQLFRDGMEKCPFFFFRCLLLDYLEHYIAILI
jgi:hypothetical protein